MTRGMRRGSIIWCITAVVAILGSIAMPSLAWARYRSTSTETNNFATHVLLAPGRPTCNLLGLLSVTLTWSAPSDAGFFTSYELGRSSTTGTGYSYTDMGMATSASPAIFNGNQYFVVRTVNQAWRSPLSAERHVNGLLGVATCPGP